MRKSTGKLIVIEGVDGSGKGTQSKLLVENLKKMGIRSILFSFPDYDDSFFGKMVGEYLNGDFGPLENIHPKLASVLFAGDRFESAPFIEKYIQRGFIVVCDRYTYSNIAYQCSRLPEGQRQSMQDWLSMLEHGVFGNPKSDHTIFLDVPVDVALKMVLDKDERSYTENKTDLHESDEMLIKNSYAMYEKLSKEGRWDRIECFDPSKDRILSIDEISDKILNNVKGLLELE